MRDNKIEIDTDSIQFDCIIQGSEKRHTQLDRGLKNQGGMGQGYGI